MDMIKKLEERIEYLETLLDTDESAILHAEGEEKERLQRAIIANHVRIQESRYWIRRLEES